MSKRKYNYGFTLIELLVVISIIGLLSSISVYAVNVARMKARDARRIGDLKQIQTALELYYDEKSYYPQSTSLGTRCNTTASNTLSGLVSEKLLPSVPVDPLNNSSVLPRYCYEYISGAATVSSWFCSGSPRSDYVWAIMFSTELVSYNFPRLTDSVGTPNNQYVYCIHGPKK